MPQLENGYIRIATELFEALIRTRIPGVEMQVFLFIVRKTYGFGKSWDYISNSQFVTATGVKKQNIQRALRSIEKKKLVIIKHDKGLVYYCINKNYSEWLLTPKKITYTLKNRVSINDFKIKTRKRDNNTCRLCSYVGEKGMENLPVHHIDFDQTNNDEMNLITLCRSCHARSHTTEMQEKLEIVMQNDVVIKNDSNRHQKRCPQKILLQKTNIPLSDIKKRYPDAHVWILDKNKEKVLKWATEKDLTLAQFMFKRIKLKHEYAAEPNYTSWADEIRLFRGKYNIEHLIIQQVFIWANEDERFWWRQIRSPVNLRKHFETIVAEMKQKKPVGDKAQQQHRRDMRLLQLAGVLNGDGKQEANRADTSLDVRLLPGIDDCKE